MLNQQYRMHPALSHFPRRMFYGGTVMDGPNVLQPEYGNPLRNLVLIKAPTLKVCLICECRWILTQSHVYVLSFESCACAAVYGARLGLEGRTRWNKSRQFRRSSSRRTFVQSIATTHQWLVDPVTSRRHYSVCPIMQIASTVLRRTLGQSVRSTCGSEYSGWLSSRESNSIIFSCVRAAGSHGIGFLSDVRRMNVALTRAKHFHL